MARSRLTLRALMGLIALLAIDFVILIWLPQEFALPLALLGAYAILAGFAIAYLPMGWDMAVYVALTIALLVALLLPGVAR